MKAPNKRHSIGRKNAIALSETEWWTGINYKDIAMFQMFTKELTMPFEVFHESLEKALGRPVWTHEFGLDYDGLASELLGERAAPTMDDIMGLIPEEKRIIVYID